MRITRIGLIAGAALLAVPAAGLAAGTGSPANGKFTGAPHYTSRGKQVAAKLTITVARHKIVAVELRASGTNLPPLAKDSSGEFCGAINDLVSKGHKSKGTIGRNGTFKYAFTQATKYKGHVVQTDTITLAGRFSTSKRVTGTFRDVAAFTAASAPGKARCDSGKLTFSASHR